MKKIFCFLFALVVVTEAVAEEENPFKNLDYPELQVAPRATERLNQMAQIEDTYGPLNQWTILSSGLLTALAGFRNKGNYKSINPSDSEVKESDMASNTAMSVGVAWVAVGGYLSFRKPISSNLADVKKVTAKDRRGELTRERIAEEVMEHASKTQATLNNIAVFSNLGASLYMTSTADSNNRVFGLIAATASVLPWVFPNMYELNYNKHIEYKRKIYAPLVWLDVKPGKSSQVNLNWSF
ncbi:MAG: hypothetical protein ACXVCY_05015 [Pseudobdellovibrionaceae bacterium]